MLFRNSLRLFMENFKNVYKILLYKIVVAILAAALYSALLLPQVLEILESAQMAELIGSVKGFFSALLNGADSLHTLRGEISDSLKDVLALISSKTLSLILSVVLCGVVYLGTRLADTLCYFSIGDMLGDKMETYAETHFGAAYVKNFGRGIAYATLYTCTIFLFDILVFAGCYFLFFYLLSFLNVFASLFLSVTSIILANALKLTLTSTWLPAMTADELSLGKAIRSWKNVQKKLRGGIYSTYLVSVYILTVVNVIGAIATLGSALFITLPGSYFFLICLQYVNYYTLTGKKYFLTHERIVTNEMHGDESLAVELIAQAASEETEEAAERRKKAEK